MLTFPKDSPRLRWTRHIKNKMVFYHLSGATIMSIFRKADRREEGVAPETSAAMRVVKEKEIWIMYQTKAGKKITMISAWRYPGRTKPGERVPIPSDILTELTEAGTL